MPIPVPASKLFMSLLARDKSTTLVCSSLLTVDNSSFTDCNSSFDVSSSSLVDCNSSFTDCISSLDDFSSSLELSNSSCVVCKYSSLARNSCISASIRVSASTSNSFSCVLSALLSKCALSITWAGTSSKIIKYKLSTKFLESRLASVLLLTTVLLLTLTLVKTAFFDSKLALPPTVAGQTVKFTIVKWPFVLTRMPIQRTVSLVFTAASNVDVKSRRNPSRDIFKMLLMPTSPEFISRYMPVLPCRYKISPCSFTNALAGAIFCNSVCSVNSFNDILAGNIADCSFILLAVSDVVASNKGGKMLPKLPPKVRVNAPLFALPYSSLR